MQDKLEELEPITEQQSKFIDKYLQTMDVAASAKYAGYDAQNALRIGVQLLSNDIIKQHLVLRKNDLNKFYTGLEMTKEDVMRIMWNMYSSAMGQGKVKEAKDILNDIARWNGVEPDKIKIEQPKIIFEGVDGTRI